MGQTHGDLSQNARQHRMVLVTISSAICSNSLRFNCWIPASNVCSDKTFIGFPVVLGGALESPNVFFSLISLLLGAGDPFWGRLRGLCSRSATRCSFLPSQLFLGVVQGTFFPKRSSPVLGVPAHPLRCHQKKCPPFGALAAAEPYDLRHSLPLSRLLSANQDFLPSTPFSGRSCETP